MRSWRFKRKNKRIWKRLESQITLLLIFTLLTIYFTGDVKRERNIQHYNIPTVKGEKKNCVENPLNWSGFWKHYFKSLYIYKTSDKFNLNILSF